MYKVNGDYEGTLILVDLFGKMIKSAFVIFLKSNVFQLNFITK